MKEELLLLGGGGHAKVIIDTIKEYDLFNIVGVLDKKVKIGQKLNGIPFIGTDQDLFAYYEEGIKNVFIAVGSCGNPDIRVNLYSRAKQIGFNVPNIIDRSSKISPSSLLGEGNYIGKFVVINADSVIGNCCILNTNCIVEHDCKIEDFVHLAPRSTLCGNVKIGKESHIGSGAVVIQNQSIGKNTIVGAGSVVIRSIGDNSICYGIPAK